ncbi:plastid/chloroplast ribosomal protein L15 [Dunaliella salina]|uniref:Plastid/chloroplast ribosomal protein L15 n=1 Tax=Dunaliella salina TaxID=3046 RepID=A0ABQ7GYN8_DUNSA|nr:plastid/chloroplast ribosomal protein L15 [Dunaliella salina]|eukprot:KAF5839710.1 plastid/chloroplast ribosomal protein L15 [Dunaliella salina]
MNTLAWGRCPGLAKACAPLHRAAVSRAPVVQVNAERLHLGNLSPSPGSTRREARKGRGYSAGQGGTCGFGNRGQKARSGPGTRTGFEGGQMPLYRRLPKLKGICGGMGAGQPDFVVLNLDKLEGRFEPGEEVTMEKLKEKGFVRASGRRRNLPLKVLGDGELKTGLSIKAGAFSASAKAKIEAAGGQAEVVAPRRKWTRAGHKKHVEALKAAGKDYAVEKRKRRAEACQRKGLVNKKRSQDKKGKAAAK